MFHLKTANRLNLFGHLSGNVKFGPLREPIRMLQFAKINVSKEYFPLARINFKWAIPESINVVIHLGLRLFTSVSVNIYLHLPTLRFDK